MSRAHENLDQTDGSTIYIASKCMQKSYTATGTKSLIKDPKFEIQIQETTKLTPFTRYFYFIHIHIQYYKSLLWIFPPLFVLLYLGNLLSLGTTLTLFQHILVFRTSSNFARSVSWQHSQMIFVQVQKKNVMGNNFDNSIKFSVKGFTCLTPEIYEQARYFYQSVVSTAHVTEV